MRFLLISVGRWAGGYKGVVKFLVGGATFIPPPPVCIYGGKSCFVFKCTRMQELIRIHIES
jgi:hypothetical protein